MSFNSPDTPMAFRYVDHLADRIEADTSLSKGEQRKTKLLLAAAEILQDGAYHNMRIADVIKRAGVARGTFYIYFEDKSDIALQVLTDFRATMFNVPRVNFSGKDWRTRIYLANLYFAEVHQMNDGLLRAFYQFVDEADDFRKMRHVKEREWVDRLYHAYARVFGPAETNEDRANVLRRLHALRVMIEGLCMQVYVESMSEMVALFPTPQKLAETATDLWIDALTTSEAASAPEVNRAG